MKYIIGIDEAGRGPLAGPLAVGGVIFKGDVKIEHEYFQKGIKDSKKLTALRREKLFTWLKENTDIQHAVAFAPSALIDQAGVTVAIHQALEGVLSKLIPEHCDLKDVTILLDGGLTAPERYTNQKTIIKGDEKERAIALASVAAKVVRDKRMIALSKKYPQYGFEQHKGYGTKAHFESIKEYGLCDEHRRRFLRRE
tara:strand:- start:48638 stop:49228 length:591 start_codon:yes stop_codon:yes gene_type:complete